MPKLFDPRADNVPDWIWHPRPHPSVGDGEIIPTSDPDEVELEMPKAPEVQYNAEVKSKNSAKVTTTKCRYEYDSSSSLGSSFDILDPVFQAKMDAMWENLDNIFPEFTAWRRLRETSKNTRRNAALSNTEAPGLPEDTEKQPNAAVCQKVVEQKTVTFATDIKGAERPENDVGPDKMESKTDPDKTESETDPDKTESETDPDKTESETDPDKTESETD